jgi:hypothetical protein
MDRQLLVILPVLPHLSKLNFLRVAQFPLTPRPQRRLRQLLLSSKTGVQRQPQALLWMVPG